MATKSSNTQGNPYHDEEGKFTSADNNGSKSGQELQNQDLSVQKLEQKAQLKTDADLSTIKKTSIKLKQGKTLQGLIDELNDINQVANIPHLQSARDIENNIEQFFSKQVCSKIDELYGRNPNISSYQYTPKSNPGKVLEIFPNVLAKYRYKDNHAHYIDQGTYSRNANDFEHIYRGFSSTGSKAQAILDAYCDASLGSFDYLCPNNGNCHGSNVYTSIYQSTARSYAGYGGTVIYGLLDNKSSFYMYERTIAGVQNNINYTGLEDRIKNAVEKNGIETTRAQRIAHSFCRALQKDVGLCAILLGCDYFIATDSEQRNLLNLGKWYIRK